MLLKNIPTNTHSALLPTQELWIVEYERVWIFGHFGYMNPSISTNWNDWVKSLAVHQVPGVELLQNTQEGFSICFYRLEPVRHILCLMNQSDSQRLAVSHSSARPGSLGRWSCRGAKSYYSQNTIFSQNTCFLSHMLFFKKALRGVMTAEFWRLRESAPSTSPSSRGRFCD